MKTSNTSESIFTIGQMAAKSGLTRRALRLYEQSELLVPERAENGYRRYVAQQLRDALVIRDLRAAGLSLELIKQLIAIKHTDWTVEKKLSGVLGVLDQMYATLITKRQVIDAALEQIETYQHDARDRLEALEDPSKARLESDERNF